MKKQLIKKIKTLISEIGYTTTCDLESQCSQVYSTAGKDHYFLAEGYGKKTIKVVEYIHETEVGESEREYEGLKVWQLKEVLAELKQYAETL